MLAATTRRLLAPRRQSIIRPAPTPTSGALFNSSTTDKLVAHSGFLAPMPQSTSQLSAASPTAGETGATVDDSGGNTSGASLSLS